MPPGHCCRGPARGIRRPGSAQARTARGRRCARRRRPRPKSFACPLDTTLTAQFQYAAIQLSNPALRRPAFLLSSCLPFFLPTFLPAYLPAFLPTFLPSCLPSCLSAYLPAFLPTFLPSFLSAILQS